MRKLTKDEQRIMRDGLRKSVQVVPRYTGYERTFWHRHAADFVVGAIVCAIVLVFMWVGGWG